MNNERNHAIIEVNGKIIIEVGDSNPETIMNSFKLIAEPRYNGEKPKVYRNQVKGSLIGVRAIGYLNDNRKELINDCKELFGGRSKHIKDQGEIEMKTTIKEKRIAELRERERVIFAGLDEALETLTPLYIEGGGSGAVFIAELLNSLIDEEPVLLDNIYRLDRTNFDAVMKVLKAWHFWPGEARTRMIAALYK